MKDKITEKEIKTLDELWHMVILNFQKNSSKLWGKELEGATTVELSILNIVDAMPGVMIKKIKEILDIPPSTLTNAIGRLEKRGLIERVINKEDLRSFGIELTDVGRSAQKKHKESERELCIRILEALETSEDRSIFLGYLKKIMENY